MTNADRIRKMTDEEFKDWFCGTHHDCRDCKFKGGFFFDCEFLQWLKMEVTE